MGRTWWRIGELAEATGLTVRTLHHFDEIGLLRPAERSAGGHRIYTGDDVRRLYRILALRQVGLPLREIGSALDGEAGELEPAIRAQLDVVNQELERQHVVQRRLTEMVRAIERGEGPSAGQLIDAMEAMMQASYFTKEQLAQAKAKHDEPGFAGRFARWQDEFTEIANAMREEMERGADAGDEAVQDLARRWSGVMDEMAGGDSGVVSSIYAKIDGKGASAATRGILDAEVWEFLKRAFAVGFRA
jgi:DNA-binding transcriptional MerR regulator